MKRCPNCRASYPDRAVFCPIDGAPLAAEVSDPLVGRMLDGKYLIEAQLGEGGMGRVYRARHEMLDRTVAVKVLNEEMRADSRTAERFRREAQAAARLEHPNAVTIHDFGVTDEGNAYLVMELLKGSSLREILLRSGRLTLDRTAEVIEQVGSAIDRAHQAGIVHRDLKPDNIMVEARADGTYSAKVLDFGIAKLKDRAETASNLTATGTVLGTVAYMSPEQCRGTEIDGRSDIYSLGVVLYEMVTGRVPFSSMTPSAIVAGHVSDPPPPPRTFHPDLPAAVEELILAALAKRPDDRPQTAGELARRFRSAISGGAADRTVPIGDGTSQGAVETARVGVGGAGAAPTMRVASTPVPQTQPATVPAPPHAHARQTPAIVWALVGALIVAIVGAGAAVVFGLMNTWRQPDVPITSGPAATAPAPAPSAPAPTAPAQPALAPAGDTAPSAKSPDPLAPAGDPGPPPAPTPLPPPPAEPGPEVDRGAVAAETRAFLGSWTASIEAKDVEGNLAHYANTVDYYRAGPVPQRRIAVDRARAFAKFDDLKITVTRIHSVTPSPDGTEITVVFDKAWKFTGRTGSSSGAVQQELVLERAGRSFRIVRERDLVAY